MFCYGFQHNLRGPAWTVGSYSISQSAGRTSQNIIFQTLQQIGRYAPLCIRVCTFQTAKKGNIRTQNPTLGYSVVLYRYTIQLYYKSTNNYRERKYKSTKKPQLNNVNNIFHSVGHIFLHFIFHSAFLRI